MENKKGFKVIDQRGIESKEENKKEIPTIPKKSIKEKKVIPLMTTCPACKRCKTHSWFLENTENGFLACPDCGNLFMLPKRIKDIKMALSSEIKIM